MSNPIATMFGPAFLLFYGCVILATLGICAWLVRRNLDTSHPPPSIPPQPDPYEIAYLRGGENEVMRLAVFQLLQRGYLHIAQESGLLGLGKTQALAQTAPSPDLSALSSLEREVYDIFARPITSSALFQTTLRNRLERHCIPYRLKLQRERLLNPPHAKETAMRVGLVGAAVIIGLGGYKLIAALDTGHYNIGFLLMMGVISLPILAAVCQVPRLTARGRDYLERLQNAFYRLKLQKQEVLIAGADPDPSLLLVGVFGIAALTETPYAEYEQMFHRSTVQSGSSGSCGGGCGSSCGGGSGDGGGGGCGGCGGGGGD